MPNRARRYLRQRTDYYELYTFLIGWVLFMHWNVCVWAMLDPVGSAELVCRMGGSGDCTFAYLGLVYVVILVMVVDLSPGGFFFFSGVP